MLLLLGYFVLSTYTLNHEKLSYFPQKEYPEFKSCCVEIFDTWNDVRTKAKMLCFWIRSNLWVL